MAWVEKHGPGFRVRYRLPDGVAPQRPGSPIARRRNHILPRFGDAALGEISRMAVKGWVKGLRRSLAERTVGDVVTLLSMLLGEAVDEGLIGANPCRRLRINSGDQEERPHAAPWQVPAIAQRCSPPTVY